MSRDRFLREAVRLASESVSGNGGPFGAIVVRHGEIVGRGQNRVTVSRDPTAHAEVVAIRDACANLGSHQLAGCELYSSSEPCPMCLGAIYWARPDAVYFANERDEAAAAGFDDAFIYDEIELLPGDRRIRMVRVNVDGAGEPFRLWQAKTDRVEY
jgi:tRNA(Arg) A34 adenosine deaminase TadA